MPNPFVNQKLGVICQQCTDERKRYFQEKRAPSPACVELFRRAFAIEAPEDAWHCLKTLFDPLLISWSKGQSRFEVEDVVQESWLSFYRGAVGKFQIRDQEQLEPILDYLRTCTKNVIAQWMRKAPPGPTKLAETLQEPLDVIEQTQLRVDLERYVAEFLTQDHFTEEDRQLFTLKFFLHLKPREIQADYPHLAADYEQLENALQKITRRVSNYADFHNLRSPRRKTDDRALLVIEQEEVMAEQEISVDHPCRYEEAVLLNYIMGMTEAAMAAAIERSPACLQRVHELAQRFGPFLRFAYRMNCPAPEELVAYQQRTLPASERLVFYRHFEQCPRCREDLMTLTTIDAAEGVATKPFLQQVIEAIYQSPLAFGLQGDWLHYRTAEVFINISTRQNRTKARSWTIHAQIRSHEGELLTTTVVAATLAQLDQTEPNIYQLDESSHTSSLIFREVQPGVYCLSIVLPEQEIIIRRVEIGSDN
jgi:DNA-directed RNA polymerase specialized sigma24 family protein